MNTNFTEVEELEELTQEKEQHTPKDKNTMKKTEFILDILPVLLLLALFVWAFIEPLAVDTILWQAGIVAVFAGTTIGIFLTPKD